MSDQSDDKKDLRKPNERPVSPKHPGNDSAMPPYQPGGVPAPEADNSDPPATEHGEREVPPSGFPPKRAP
jgi:hypothetical protein